MSARAFGRPAMVETWTLENQYQISPNLFVALGYLGNHATRLHGLDRLSQRHSAQRSSHGQRPLLVDIRLRAGHASLPQLHTTVGLWATEPVEQALRPFPQYGYINKDSYLQNVGQASYDALTAKLERRFHNGLNVLASYTFSKTLTDADAIQPYYSTLQNQGGRKTPMTTRRKRRQQRGYPQQLRDQLSLRIAGWQGQAVPG